MHSSREYIYITTTIYLALLLSQILLLSISIWGIIPHRYKEHDIYYIISVVVIYLVGLCISYKLSVKYIEKGKTRRGIREKLIIYKKALYSQWFTLAFMSLSAIVSYLITAEKAFIFASMFAIILLLLNKPGIKKTIEDLEMDENEARILQTPDAAL